MSVTDVQELESVQAMLWMEQEAVITIRMWTNEARQRLGLPVRKYGTPPGV